MYLERYVNDGSDHKFKDQSDVPVEYQPRSKQNYICIYRLADDYTKQDDTLPQDFYPIHPFTAKVYRELGQKVKQTDFKGIPTSSTRTVLISNDDFKHSYLVKLDLPLKISRFDRSVAKSDVIFSQQINEELWSLRIDSDASIGTFVETGGGFTTLRDGRQVGYITRELIPRWFTHPPQDTFFLVPSFSLISHDANHPNDTPLLIQLINQAKNPKKYVLEVIMLPLLDYWFALARRGLIWELQQQNTLFVMNKDKQTIGVVSRDFDGVYIDAIHREKIGLSSNFVKHTLDKSEDLTLRYSLTFDHRVCKQNLVRMLVCIAEYLGEDLANSIKTDLTDYIDKNLPRNVREALPKDAWYTCPEVMFQDEIETIVVPHPPLRS